MLYMHISRERERVQWHHERNWDLMVDKKYLWKKIELKVRILCYKWHFMCLQSHSLGNSGLFQHALLR